MGQVLQRAGGGKVTVEGLTVDVVKSGASVTVKQGSKTVQTVTGTLNLKVVDLGSVSNATTIDIKEVIADWGKLTSKNFVLALEKWSYNRWSGTSQPPYGGRGYSPSVSYNNATGIVSISGTFSDSRSDCSASAVGHLYCYYV